MTPLRMDKSPRLNHRHSGPLWFVDHYALILPPPYRSENSRKVTEIAGPISSIMAASDRISSKVPVWRGVPPTRGEDMSRWNGGLGSDCVRVAR